MASSSSIEEKPFEDGNPTTKPMSRFTCVDQSLHVALTWDKQKADRLTDVSNKNRMMPREMYDDLCDSIGRIYEHIVKSVLSTERTDILGGLEALCNGGHISYHQRRAFLESYPDLGWVHVCDMNFALCHSTSSQTAHIGSVLWHLPLPTNMIICQIKRRGKEKKLVWIE